MNLNIVLFLSLLICFLQKCNADCYLHNPRGSNNRLNENSANRRNANRMFDSQNNNRGGYNTGDKDDRAFTNEAGIYYMKYFSSGSGQNGGDSILTIEWTNQHGCGGYDDGDPHKLNCNLVLQFRCQPRPEADSKTISGSDYDLLRDGTITEQQNYIKFNSKSPYYDNYISRLSSIQPQRGLQETFQSYEDCYIRKRNEGLFLADQKLRLNNNGYQSAIFTRQNPNGNRRGLECPEERDYFPYWHPTHWKDIVVLTGNSNLCDFYKRESFNVRPRYLCKESYSDSLNIWKPSMYQNEVDCLASNLTWVEFYNYLEIDETLNEAQCINSGGLSRRWGYPVGTITNVKKCLILLSEPECLSVQWSRSNHLGNTRTGNPIRYDWKIPSFSSEQRCVLRIRYNISTDDYDPFGTNSSYNQNLVYNIISPVTQNPYVNIASSTNGPLRLALNTAQFGRTFQDRSHVFILRLRNLTFNSIRIYNLNIRGKRGNIVQVYPAVEYDFIPNDLIITPQDAVQIQWTGSNTHYNGHPAGDGQAGDAGEGRGGTDRHNLLQIPSASVNFPTPYLKSNLFIGEILWLSSDYPQNTSAQELALILCSAGYYHCFQGCGNSVEGKQELNNLLNNAFASFDGPLVRFPTGVYHYMCSRNNNFTNRSQKGKLTVE